jgi:hypothetical protein
MAVSFKEKVKSLIKLISKPKELRALLSLRHTGYLIDVGWFKSFSSKKPVDKENRPIPWFTFPSIDFLALRLNKKMTVLEFGSGNSTLYFAERVNQIISIEHNKSWYDNISKQTPANSKMIFVKDENPKTYLEPIKMSSIKYDIVIVDGIYRNECLYESINYLTNSGVIILDDSERAEYSEGINKILNQEFKRIDFWGISPGCLYRKSTSIFYKEINCLGL